MLKPLVSSNICVTTALILILCFTFQPSQLDIINTKGCLKGLGDFINENAFVIGGVILGVLIPQVSENVFKLR